ncbi:tellurite resistance TerB family protein [Lewinella sp. IMCC34191]|uniref:tellurite resistance TerB family protein n=1 Tax=Lewinella sp. IMCC34191 TaxID=2259172 RepID=UPI000E233679|nr:tellurite resistance TerB family protein [Lewinella sp. IMCC34191]
MRLFGTRRVTSDYRSGNFTCPQCAAERTYRHRKVAKYLVAFNFPLIPLARLGEYIECAHCQSTFLPDVLVRAGDADGPHTLSEYEKAVRHTMVLMMLADGEVDDNELDTVLDIVNRYGDHPMSRIDLEVYAEQVRRLPQPVGTYLRQVSPSLNQHGKERLIRCAMAVASADGKIDRSEVEVIREMGRNLDLSLHELQSIINAEPEGVGA